MSGGRCSVVFSTSRSELEPCLCRKKNFMKLTFHWPILKPTTSVNNHNKEHMELKFNMKEVPNGTFCSFLLYCNEQKNRP